MDGKPFSTEALISLLCILMQLYIKNMVCNRCIMVVRQVFEQEGLHPVSVKLGEVELEKAPADRQLDTIKTKLSTLGFEILDDQKRKIIEKIRTTIIKLIHNGEPMTTINFPTCCPKLCTRIIPGSANCFLKWRASLLRNMLSCNR